MSTAVTVGAGAGVEVALVHVKTGTVGATGPLVGGAAAADHDETPSARVAPTATSTATGTRPGSGPALHDEQDDAAEQGQRAEHDRRAPIEPPESGSWHGAIVVGIEASAEMTSMVLGAVITSLSNCNQVAMLVPSGTSASCVSSAGRGSYVPTSGMGSSSPLRLTADGGRAGDHCRRRCPGIAPPRGRG